MAKLLLVEDDVALTREIRTCLADDQHLIDVCLSGNDALDHLRVSSYDLIILDWNLPDISGMDVLIKLRAKSVSTPVLMLTGMSSIESKVAGFESGADDYLTKPFHQKELVVRVKALLRRPANELESLVTYGDLQINTKTFHVTKAGKLVRLSPREFNLLSTFIRHPKVVLSSEFLLSRVWPTDSEASPEVVRKYVQKLRDKIDSKDGPSKISTVHGAGYIWTGGQ